MTPFPQASLSCFRQHIYIKYVKSWILDGYCQPGVCYLALLSGGIATSVVIVDEFKRCKSEYSGCGDVVYLMM